MRTATVEGTKRRNFIRNGSTLILLRNHGKVRDVWKPVWPAFNAGSVERARRIAGRWKRFGKFSYRTLATTI